MNPDERRTPLELPCCSLDCLGIMARLWSVYQCETCGARCSILVHEECGVHW